MGFPRMLFQVRKVTRPAIVSLPLSSQHKFLITLPGKFLRWGHYFSHHKALVTKDTIQKTSALQFLIPSQLGIVWAMVQSHSRTPETPHHGHLTEPGAETR